MFAMLFLLGYRFVHLLKVLHLYMHCLNTCGARFAGYQKYGWAVPGSQARGGGVQQP